MHYKRYYGATVRDALRAVKEDLGPSALVLSTRTVGHHVSAVLRKLGARTRGEASVQAMRLGIVDRAPAATASPRPPAPLAATQPERDEWP